MISVNWPIVITTTGILYVLTILLLPFNPLYATLFLFSIIAFWSRLPGVCIMEPLPIMYMMDFIDILAIVIAIKVNPVLGGFFAFFWTLFPRMAGIMYPYLAIFKDALILGLLAMLSPIVYTMTGSLLVTVMAFSIIRIPGLILFNLILPHRPFVEHTIRITLSGIALTFVNSFYAKIFGGFFTDLLEKGVAFNWILFLIVTFVVISFATAFLGFSPKKTVKNVSKGVVKLVRKNVHKNNSSSDREVKDMTQIKEMFK